MGRLLVERADTHRTFPWRDLAWKAGDGQRNCLGAQLALYFMAVLFWFLFSLWFVEAAKGLREVRSHRLRVKGDNQ